MCGLVMLIEHINLAFHKKKNLAWRGGRIFGKYFSWSFHLIYRKHSINEVEGLGMSVASFDIFKV